MGGLSNLVPGKMPILKLPELNNLAANNDNADRRVGVQVFEPHDGRAPESVKTALKRIVGEFISNVKTSAFNAFTSIKNALLPSPKRLTEMPETPRPTGRELEDIANQEDAHVQTNREAIDKMNEGKTPLVFETRENVAEVPELTEDLKAAAKAGYKLEGTDDSFKVHAPSLEPVTLPSNKKVENPDDDIANYLASSLEDRMREAADLPTADEEFAENYAQFEALHPKTND